MYAGTIFEIIDKSDIPPLPVAETPYKPLFYCTAPTPKGREDIQVYEGKQFYTNFGNDISFVKYGQPLLQTARIINDGGRVMFKRIVADDAQLANNTVVATVSAEVSQKLNSAGRGIYKDRQGNETIVAEGNTPVMLNKAKIKFSLLSYSPYDEDETADVGAGEGTASGDGASLDEEDEEVVIYPTGYTGGQTFYKVTYQNANYVLAGYPGDTYRVLNYDGTAATAEDTIKAGIADESIDVETVTIPSTYTPTTNTSTGSALNPVIVPGTPYTLEDIAEIAYGQNSSFTTNMDPTADPITFPLFTITDIGRGVSLKRWRIVPDYLSSKAKEIMQYTFEILEEDKVVERFAFALDPDTKDPYSGKCIDLRTQIDGKSDQIRMKYYPDAIAAFYQAISTSIGTETYTLDELKKVDVLFGTTRKGENIPSIVYDTAGGCVDLASPYGLTIDKGSNGSLGDCPTDHEDILHQLYLDAFNGSVDENGEIYDLNTYMIDIIADANYPEDVKREIENLVMFREDCVAMIDMGTELTTLDEILVYAQKAAKSRYVYQTFLAYDIIDPYTNRQIKVTAMYDLVAKLVPHFANGRSRAFAGIKHDVILESAIKGTVNFIPKIVPSINQNQVLDDAKINYASYYDGRLVMETEYSTQERYTQLSYINNVFNLQDLIKAIRARCPIIRYTFMDKEGLKEYQEDVTAIIDRYTDKYMSISFHYIEDKIYEQNHIYYAAIEVRFKNFVQTEWFKITALPSDL